MNTGVPHITVPLIIENQEPGYSYGAEALINWQALDYWRVQAWYSYLKLDIADEVDGSSPRNQAMIRSLMTINNRVEFDPSLHYYDSLPSLGIDSFLPLKSESWI